jgi:hypothetical protein
MDVSGRAGTGDEQHHAVAVQNIVGWVVEGVDFLVVEAFVGVVVDVVEVVVDPVVVIVIVADIFVAAVDDIVVVVVVAVVDPAVVIAGVVGRTTCEAWD